MGKLRTKICLLLGGIILSACILPALHSLSHETSFGGKDISSILYSEMDAKGDCDLCLFHLTTSDFPEFFSYTLCIPLKEDIYIVSLEDKVNPFPFRLFQLRAPPALIG
ncbi:hypothetical protein [Autumnicola musiva]|uniref:Uncharacterized protein n=1 Tax=Autumnicola musiva TaxID=3075589 RepID=A0ABU3DAD0_9FLAO|nr:hypothetical protein [Zunongwangia sp. F117]MDT0678496.1 hypothetical protein [Zunongwangia sp. F117]